jgi:hypothetical protein
MGVSHIVPPKDNTAMWIKVLPHLLLAFLLIILFKIIKFVFNVCVRLVGGKSKLKDKRA